MTLSAVLLAGGESRRMGVEKATVVFKGEPLWEKQLSLLRELNPETIFVSARTERDWRPADTELLLDEPPARGPLSGIAAALTRTKSDQLLVLAVDMPFMTRGQLRFLCGQATAGCGVLPMIGERAEPLAAVYPKAASSEFSAALVNNDFTVHVVARHLFQAGKMRTIQIAEDERALYQSVNEPGDLPSGIACPNSVDARPAIAPLGCAYENC